MTVREFVDAVDTPGAHIVISLLVGGVGMVLAVVALWYGHDMIATALTPMTGFLSTAAYAMRGTDKANAQVTTSKTETATSPIEEKK